MGLIDGAPAVGALAAAVGEAMSPLVGEGGAREYHAHLTLARLGRPADLRAAAVQATGTAVGPRWLADRLVLFESVTAPGGARYRAHAEVALEPNPTTG
jgi:2'-5' RNA ligase